MNDNEDKLIQLLIDENFLLQQEIRHLHQVIKQSTKKTNDSHSDKALGVDWTNLIKTITS